MRANTGHCSANKDMLADSFTFSQINNIGKASVLISNTRIELNEWQSPCVVKMFVFYNGNVSSNLIKKKFTRGYLKKKLV